MEGIPEDSEEFWVFIENNYLYLEREPKDVLTEISLQVADDFQKIAENLEYISKEKAALEDNKRKNRRLSADERYYRNQLDYFENKNIVAKDEIVDFITTGMKPYAIKKAGKLSLATASFSLFKESPYAFGRTFFLLLGDPYDVRSLDEYVNKFSDLPVSAYKKIVSEIKESPDKFKEVAHWYVTGVTGELPSIKEKLVKKSHILERRKQIISTMLRHFEEEDYISFVSIAPLQIEGIFADICREIGISENRLDISSLNDKLEHIEGKLNSFFYFEYYSFKFPVLRNHVAHGELVEGDLEDTALRLMLDLLPVCELAVSEELPINNALTVLDEASKENYSKLIEWLSLRENVVISDFYNVKGKISVTEEFYASSGFWEYLERELKTLRSVDQIRNSIPMKVAGMLKRNGLAISQADRFLKSAFYLVSEAIKERDNKQ